MTNHEPDFKQVPHVKVIGSARPKRTVDLRVSEINTQTYASGARGGTTAGQGPAIDAK